MQCKYLFVVNDLIYFFASFSISSLTVLASCIVTWLLGLIKLKMYLCMTYISKISSFTQFFIHQNFVSCFYLLIFYFEKHSNWIWRLPFAVCVELLKLSTFATTCAKCGASSCLSAQPIVGTWERSANVSRDSGPWRTDARPQTQRWRMFVGY